MMHTLFEAGSKIIRRLDDAGFEGFFVGGCVRDFYMGRDIQDVDITTDAKPEEVEHLFEKTIDVGREHGTIIVMADDTPFEVTTYRTDGAYTDHRRPDTVIFSDRLDEDLKRRDFTMNAMAMAEDYTFHDPYGGRGAIERGEIMTVGQAADRFGEDALRMVRALRFMSVLDFTIEKATEAAIGLNAPLLEHVSIERIVTEFKKMYKGPALKEAREKLIFTELIRHIPFFKEAATENLLGSRVGDMLDELIVQVILDPALEDALHHLKLSRKELAAVRNSAALYEALEGGVHPLEIAYAFDEELISRFSSINEDNDLTDRSSVLSEVKTFRGALPIRSKKDLAINGRDLMALYQRRSGPWIKECLNIVEREVLFGKLKNDQNDIIDWMGRHVKVKSTGVEIIE